jgi:phosphate starvation-inducible protein PhoH and related proteins
VPNLKKPLSQTVTLTPENNQRLTNLCGQYNQNLQQIEKYFGVELHNRGNIFEITGAKIAIANAKIALKELFAQTLKAKYLTPELIHLTLQAIKANNIMPNNSQNVLNKPIIRTRQITITPHTQNQINYINNIRKFDVNFSVGPAGTGKTFLAVACAIEALVEERIKRVILVRPAVEAGEHLGFLPGDIAQKVDPYLRPLYDALYEMLGTVQVEKLIAEHIIELAPLAFMRGRTLNNAFIILDESQNTTKEQMKMLLTRIGFGSKAVITGDITQIDLAKNQQSGLIHAIKILKDEPEISFNYFQIQDVVRHHLVQRIIEAYDKEDKDTKSNL